MRENADKDLKKISPQNRTKFMRAVKKVASRVIGKEPAQDIIVKVAEEENLSPDYLKHLVSCYNTSLQLGQIKRADALDDKVVDIDAIDGEKLLASIYKKEAGVLDVSAEDFYRRDPGDFVRKSASLETPTLHDVFGEKKASEFPRATHLKTAKCRNTLEKLAREERACKAEERVLKWDLLSQLSKSAIELGAPSVPAFEEVETRVLAKLGSISTAFMEALARDIGAEKRGSVSSGILATDMATSPYATIASGVDTCRKIITLEKSRKRIGQEKMAAAQEIIDLTDSPGVAQRFLSLYGIDTRPQSKKASSPEADVLALNVSDVSGQEKRIGPKEQKPKKEVPSKSMEPLGIENLPLTFFRKAKAITGALHDITMDDREEHNERISGSDVFTPQHENEIMKIKTQAVLNTILSHDEILRDYPPEDVVDAFNEISRLYPNVIEHKALLSGLLQQMMAAQYRLEPSQALSLIDEARRLQESKDR